MVDYVELADEALDQCERRADITSGFLVIIAERFFIGESCEPGTIDQALDYIQFTN